MPADLHRAAEAELVPHRRHGHAALGEDERFGQLAARLLDGQAVALARLHGQPDTQAGEHGRRPRAAREHEFVGHEGTRRRVHGREAAGIRLPAVDGGVPLKLHAHFLQERREGGNEFPRRDVRINRKINRADDIELRAGFERGGLRRVEHARLDPELVGDGGETVRLVVERLLRLAKVEQTLGLQLEGVAGDIGQLHEKFPAAEAKVAQDRRGAARVLRRAMAGEQPAPAHQVAVEARLDVERAARAQHPLQALEHHAGGRQRHHVTRRDVTGAAVRARVRPLGVALDQRDAETLAGEVVGRAQPDNAAATDDNRLGLTHISGYPRRTGRRDRGSRSPRR